MTRTDSPNEALEVQLSVASHDLAYVVLNTADGRSHVPPHAVVGRVAMKDGAVLWPSFQPNPAFVTLLSEYMRGVHGIPPGIGQATVSPGESFVVIDGRCRDPDGRVLPEDILGTYRTDPTGRPLQDTFEHNPRHQLVRGDGALSSYLRHRRVHEIIDLLRE